MTQDQIADILATEMVEFCEQHVPQEGRIAAAIHLEKLLRKVMHIVLDEVEARQA